MQNNTPVLVAQKNLWTENPVMIQVLGICSALAVTNTVINTLIMTCGVVFVTGFSSFTLSLMKKLIPRRVRMIVQTLIIAFYVILVDIFLRAFLPDISRSLGPYVGLIITNCIIMGRAEAFAQSNAPIISLWDGLLSGAGYMWVLLCISVIREVLGFGTILGFSIVPAGFVTWTIMLTPPSAFFLIGIMIWIVKSISMRKEKSK
ncbi:MAG: NADH:ubiquinone reductase (Na(+)-transporting) subunit D [Spirochaetales bacterium]|nr:NADH:ubiquinone reductase (Na(+)-transporting) subunit D [Spirochaetales bacterium]